MKDSQRKAMFARMSGLKRLGFSDVSARFYAQKGVNPNDIKQKNFRQLQKQGIYLKYQQDKDHDGIKNINDCQPLNSKKQGIIHDWKISRLKKQEEKAESRKEKMLKELEDKRDEIELRKSIARKDMTAREAEVAQKTNVVNERKKEEDEKAAIEAKLKAANKYLHDTSTIGRMELKGKAYGTEIKRRWNSQESKNNRKKAGKALKKIWRKLN